MRELLRWLAFLAFAYAAVSIFGGNTATPKPQYQIVRQ